MTARPGLKGYSCLDSNPVESGQTNGPMSMKACLRVPNPNRFLAKRIIASGLGCCPVEEDIFAVL